MIERQTTSDADDLTNAGSSLSVGRTAGPKMDLTVTQTTKFYVVDFRYNEKDVHADNERVFTVSTNPSKPGWETDGGFDGYGLTKAEAQFLADAANEKIARDLTTSNPQIITPIKSVST